MTERLLDTLNRIAGRDTACAVDVVDGADGLIGAEHDAIARAIPKRQAEFAAGRRAARRALAAFGLTGVSVPAGADRAPQWPSGYVGAITHDKGLAAAITAQRETHKAIGLDLEMAEPFPEDLRNRILISEAERSLDGLEARAVFSAKETLFKALHPLVKVFFGFEAADISVNLADEIFTARLTTTVGAFDEGTVFQGHVAICEDRLITVLTLPV